MRVALNLAVHQSAHERYALYWAPAVGLGALVAWVYLSVGVVRTLGEYRRVRGSVAECQAQQKALREREQAALRRLQQAPFQRVLRVANYVNGLIDQRRMALTSLTAKLTRLLPADVRLTALSLSPASEGPQVRMAIESSDQQRIIAFVQNLEESMDFSEPVISSEDPAQSGRGTAPAGVVRLICTARYAGWRNVEAAEAPGEENGEEQGTTIVSPVAEQVAGAAAVSSQKPAVGSQKAEVKNQKSEARIKK